MNTVTVEEVIIESAIASADTAIPVGTDRLLGAHMPTAGGLYKALISGKAIGCTAVQLFTSSPRQWNAPPLKESDIAAFRKAREETGIQLAVAHDSYLINLAAPSEEVLLRSQGAFRAELDRAEQLNLSWLVTHMGAHLDQGEDAAFDRLIASLKHVLDATDGLGYTVGIALETTAGQGTGLGWTFEQLGRVIEGVGHHPRLGVCLDTCHIFVAGYDIRTEETYEATLAAFDKHIGLDRLKVIHANDAKKPLGSRVDRHEHIGQGEIGKEAFARLVTDPRLRCIPVIIETPDSDTMHPVNLSLLQRMVTGQADLLTITVHLFGHYSELCGGEPVELTVTTGATVRDVALLLAERDERLARSVDHCRFAVDEEYAALDTMVTDGCIVAALPPMSGG
jgi:deoxyribonuclease-4